MSVIITIGGWIFLAIIGVALIALAAGVFFIFWKMGETLASDWKWRRRIMRSNTIKNAYVCAKYLTKFDFPDIGNANIYKVRDYFYKRLKETEE